MSMASEPMALRADGVVPFRKSRATKGVTEAYYFILSLAWNDIVTNGGKLSVRQQEESIKLKSCQWADTLHSEFPHVPLKPEVTSSILNIEINMDSGNGMIRKAKEMIHYISNVLNPVWKDMNSNASFSEVEDALLDCRKVAWIRNEHDRKKKRKIVAPKEMNERPFDPAWTFKEWLTFRYLGMPAGEAGCLKIFQATFPGSVAFHAQKKSALETRSKDGNNGERSQIGRSDLIDDDDAYDGERDGGDSSGTKRSKESIRRQSLWEAEKNRLETLISLSEKLNMPSEVQEAHLRSLYTYLLTPYNPEDAEEAERDSKIQKREHSSTPASAIALSSSCSTSSSSAGDT
jgi:hypothetical protein